MSNPISRTPVSAPQNVFFDTRTVDGTALTLEQNFNNLIQAGIINNHFGSGVLPATLVDNILFDSQSVNGLLDGIPVNVQAQPSDPNNGNQLQVTLSNSFAAGTRTVKVVIIGLDFQNNLIYNRFIFNTNETQISATHFRSIITVLFNDFIGPPLQSLNLGGTIIISEATAFSLSRDPIMIAQDIQPNLFFRDFFVVSGGTVTGLLTQALPSYNIGALNITTGYLQLRSIVENDVSSQVGQKFLATTNNIQKITLLLSVINNAAPTVLVWTGDLLISIYALQTSVDCISDIIPQLAIDFDPSNIPVAQLSVNYNSLLASGIQLNTVPQPVDFVFSNTSVGSGLVISPNSYYMVTVKRTGAATTCQMQFAVGSNASATYMESLFNGSVWTDVPQESLWFQVWTDAVKVSDGAAYDNGSGIQIPKNQIDPITGLTTDYVLGDIQFTGNAIYSALAQAALQNSVPLQNQRTGEPVDSVQQYVPSISLLNATALANIQAVSSPFIIGTVTDQNVRSFGGNGVTLGGEIHEYGFVKNQIVMKVITDPTDVRYDQNIILLASEIVNNTLYGAQFTPNVNNPSFSYKIAKAEYISMMYGDVDGNGIIDNNDILAAQQLLNTNLNIIPNNAQYIDNISPFVNDILLTWQVVNPIGPVVVASGSDGILTTNPDNPGQADFNSASANFTPITNIGSFNIIISNSTASAGNNGTFSIINNVDNNDITIQKVLYTSDTILEILRADISGDMTILSDDVNYISNYVNVVPPFPPATSPANKIGTIFYAIRFTLEEYIDRYDDYPANSISRSSILHTLPDLYIDGHSLFANQNLNTTPLTYSIAKQLTWTASSIAINSNPRLVSAAFGYQSGYELNSCSLQGVLAQTFPQPPSFDPGRNDFFIPNNLIINNGGQLIAPDGYYYKVDFETNTITFEIPDGYQDGYFDTEKTVNLLNLIADIGGTSHPGYTFLGYPAMRFADCSTVGLDALSKNQVRFSVAAQSFSPQLYGLDPACLSGIIVDGKIGVSINYTTGILTLNFANLYQDLVRQTLNTKVEVTVYIKKAGWNNTPIFVDSTKAANILGILPQIPPSTICPEPVTIIMS
jgi:hypothetical protein